jgi:hypothetical protein
MANEPKHIVDEAPARYYKRLFVAASAWNMISAISVVFFLTNSSFRHAIGFPGTPDVISLQLLSSCLFVFGLGYFWVSRDLSRNRDLVTLGVIGKPLVFLVFFGHAVALEIPMVLVIPSLVDLLLGALFLEFLVRTSNKSQ